MRRAEVEGAQLNGQVIGLGWPFRVFCCGF
jgi:hypothetical protein